MAKASIIGVDLAKHVFQVHGASVDGSVAFRKKISRAKLLPFLSLQRIHPVSTAGWAISAAGSAVRGRRLFLQR